MKILTEKNKNVIGKRLACIYYIAVHGFGKGTKADLESTAKIIEHVHEIAMLVGGNEFSEIMIPCYVDSIETLTRRVSE